MNESTELHLQQVESWGVRAVANHMTLDHGHRDGWPFVGKPELLRRHRENHAVTTTQVISDKAQVSADTIDLAVGDGQPETEDEVTVTTDIDVSGLAAAQTQRVVELERQVADLEAKLANLTRTSDQQKLVAVQCALDDYKSRVCDQVRKYLESGQLCKEEAREIISELDLDMSLGWTISVTVEITLKGVDEDMGATRLVERRIEDVIKSELLEHVNADDPDWDYVSVDVSCEEDND